MYLDVLLLFVVLFFGFLGYLHGLIRQILAFLAVIGILFFAHPMAIWLKESSGWAWFEKSPSFILWGLSALSIVLFFFAVGGVLALMRNSPALTPTERWLGAALGVVKGVILCLALTLFYHVIPESYRVHFYELHADARDSVFLKASAPFLEWKSISSINGLRQIQAELKSEELKVKARASEKLGSGPWALDPGVDRR